MYLSLKVL